MGTSTAETREELEQTRDELSATIDELYVRAQPERWVRRARRLALVVAGTAAVTGVTVATVLLVRSRRVRGPVTTAVGTLPARPRSALLPAARRTDRVALRGRDRLRQRREEAVDAFARRVAEELDRAERRRNSLPRRMASDAARTAATAAATYGVRRALGRNEAA